AVRRSQREKQTGTDHLHVNLRLVLIGLHALQLKEGRVKPITQNNQIGIVFRREILVYAEACPSSRKHLARGSDAGGTVIIQLIVQRLALVFMQANLVGLHGLKSQLGQNQAVGLIEKRLAFFAALKSNDWRRLRGGCALGSPRCRQERSDESKNQ